MRSTPFKVTGLLLLFITLFSFNSQAARYYVRNTATGTGDGASWANAFTSLTDAITKSVAGDEIWVAKGNYSPGAAKTSYFSPKINVQLYGGFSGTETAINQRVASANGLFMVNETILDGGNNSNHVVNITFTGTVVDGFTIAGGYSTVNSTANINYGGGLYSTVAGTFQNLYIRNNTSGYWGAGIYNAGASQFKNIIVESNALANAILGAGIYNSGASTFQDVSIINNSGAASGGGMYNTNANTRLLNVVFKGNSSTLNGGGLHSTVAMSLDRVSFIENSAGRNGGGYYSTGNAVLNNVMFSRNSVTGVNVSWTGGGMYIASGTNVTINNSTFSNNTIAYSVNNTNTYGAGLASAVTTVYLYNSILWGNYRTGMLDQVGTVKINMDYDLVQDGYATGTNMFIGDPVFENADANDLRLKSGSVAIDVGRNAYVGTSLDIPGNARTINGTVDLGAYEHPTGEAQGLSVSPKNLPALTRGVAFSQQLTVQNGSGAATWELTYGRFPLGLSLNKQTGVLSGTPVIAENNSFVITAKQNGLAASRQYNVTVNAGKARLYVNSAAAAGTNTGNNFANGFTRLQTALTVAESGDEIWVAKGAYEPLSSSVDSSFYMVSGVGLYGGFAGTETAISQRVADASGRFTVNESILTGNQINRHVIANRTLLAATTILDGFTVQHGYGGTTDNNGGGILILAPVVNGTYKNLVVRWNVANMGGGLYNAATGTVVDNVLFEGNSATLGSKQGGGLYNLAANATFRNLTFKGNQATTGGGMYNITGADVSLDNALFDGNVASVGGGLWTSGQRFILSNAIFQNNTANAGLGGGMSNSGLGSVITKSEFRNNSATTTGGGLSNTVAITMDRVIFIANNANGNGGGMYTSGVSTFSNLVFSRNNGTTVNSMGGGMWSTGATTLSNATFSNNTVARTAVNAGGGLFSNSVMNVNNSIFWNNSRSGGVLDQINSTANTVSYSTVQGDYATGTEILTADPLFKDAAADDLALRGGSLAIDKGNNGYTATSFDVAGNQRIYNSKVDQGAYEDQGEGSIKIAPATLGVITRGTAVNIQLTATKGTAPYTWSIVSGELPPGLALSTDGKIQGMPTTTVAGGYTFAVSVTDGTLIGTTEYTVTPVQAPLRIHVVKGLTTGQKNGGTWANAFAEFTDALSVAVSGDEIWVAKGNYRSGTAVSSYFILTEGVKWYGGFAGTETELSQRVADSNGMFSVNETLLDGNSTNYHVVANNVSLTSASVIDGFSIVNGRTATGSTSTSAIYSGAGMCITGGAPVFRNLWIKNNKAYYLGAGIYNTSAATFENIRLENNIVAGGAAQGGGIYNNGAITMNKMAFVANEATSGGGILNAAATDISINNAVFTANKAATGAGIYTNRATFTINNSTFDGNVVTSNGGAIWNSASLIGEDLVIKNNTATGTGAGAYHSGSGTMELRRTSFISNTSRSYGGGLYSITGTIRLENVAFSRNATTLASSLGYGAGMYLASGTAGLSNVTFSANSTALVHATTLSGAGFFRAGGTATIYNSIFWGNRRGNAVSDQIGGVATIYNSVIENGDTFDNTGWTNISIGNPLFTNAAEDNLRIKGGSSAMDAGENAVVTSSLDLDKNPRIVNDVVDMGAYENQGGESLMITPGTLPVLDRGAMLSQQFAAGGASGPLSWSVSSGTLPPGINLSNTGLLSGRSITTGEYTFVVSVTDGTLIGTKQFKISTNTASTHLFTNIAATGLNNGSSWQNAYTDLQSALEAAVSGDEIWVAKGTYSPGLLTTSAFTLKSGVAIYGGFAGTESTLATRDEGLIHTTNSTILDGSKGARNFHVIYNILAVTNGTIVDGFTISGGGALSPAASANGYGGGIYSNLGSPVFNNLRVTGNNALYGGGAFFNGGNVVITNSRFFANTTSGANGRGAGVFNNTGAILTLTKVTFDGNRVNAGSGTYGGGLMNYGTATIDGSVFTNNIVEGTGYVQGGAIYSANGSVLKITKSTFTGNTALSGGAIYLAAGSGDFADLTFKENIARGSAGAIYSVGTLILDRSFFIANESALHAGALFSGGANARLDNVVFSRNKMLGTGAYFGGAVYMNATGTITNATFSNNSVAKTVASGGALYRGAGTTTVNNSIFWGNTRAGNVSDQVAGIVTINKSIVQDGFAAGTNIGIGDPLFVNADLDNLRIRGGSPAIDAGDDTKTTTTIDILGNVRKYNVVDMGAYENQGTASLTITPLALDAISRGEQIAVSFSVAGTAGLTWSVSSGTLPSGITLDENGNLSGRTITSGSYTFVVTATNGELIGNRQYTLVVNAASTMLYVNAAATSGLKDGSSWPNGFTDLKAAIAQSLSGDQIWVARGSYSPGLLGTDWYTLKEGVKTYGGFAGTETSLAERDMKLIATTNQSVLDGSQGTASRHVIYNNVALTNATVIDGVTITGGQTLTGSDGESTRGGGIYNVANVKAIFSNLQLINNRGQRGAGIYNVADGTTFDHILFQQNAVTISGGGMFNNGSSVTMTDLVFKDNTAANYGAGMASNGAALVLSRSSFIGNQSVYSGAGFYLFGGGASLDNILFSRNAVTGTSYYGGGMATTVGATLTNITFSNNTTAAPTTVTGGGLYRSGGVVTVDNSIFWGNKRGNGNADQLGPNITLRQSIVQGGYAAGTNVFIGDPLFVNAAADNLQLRGGSPAIDAGDNSKSTMLTDLAGNPRKMNETVDLGAYENQGTAGLTISAVTIGPLVRGESTSTTLTATGSTGTYSWSVQSGKLPTGLMMNAGGQISGVPTVTGTYIFVVAVTDGELIGSKQFTINVTPGATRLYVHQSATGESTGSDWQNAFNELQPALTLASAGDEIWVAKGTYSPGNLSSSYFTLKEGVKIYGGFAATENTLTQRKADDIRGINETILDGSKGTVSAHVVYNTAALTDATVLDGFSIQGGVAGSSYGGGIYNTAGSALFSNLWVKNNSALYGGGLYHNGTAVYTNINFSNNIAKGSTARGAGVYTVKGFNLNGGIFENNKITEATNVTTYGAAIISGGGMQLKNVDFKNNSLVYGNGGAVYANTTEAISMENVKFSSNSATSGGAMYLLNGTQTVTDAVFENNTAVLNGGAIYSSKPLNLNRTSFLHNTAVQHGGAIWTNSTLKIDNSIFSQNSVSSKSTYYGGAIYISSGTSTFVNTTFSNNSISYVNASATLSYGGAIFRNSGTVSIYNTILWGNIRGNGIADQLNAGITVDHSIVQNNYATGTEVKIGNPSFVDAANDNLRLKAGSLAINSGLNSWQVYDKDLAGNARVIDADIDLGAYENDGSGSLKISPSTIAAIRRGESFDLQLAVTGNVAPVTWDLKDGALPGGILLSADGHLTGAATAVGNYTFVVGVTDGVTNGNKQYTISVLAGPSRLYVSASALGRNNGNSWANAFTTIQPALLLATAGDEIWVAKGTYSPGLTATSYFTLKEGVKIYGGFAGTETLLSARDIEAVRSTNETILDGSQGVASYHVIYNNATLTAATLLDGFSIQGAAAAGNHGGGIFNNAGAASFSNLWIKNNTAVYGAGIYHNGTSVYTNILFSNNQSKGTNARGAGVYNLKGFTLNGGTFENNKIVETTGYGAGIFSTGALTLTGVDFNGNSIVTGQGGAIYSNGGTTLSIEKSTFTANQAPTAGAIMITNGSSTLTDVVFTGNSATTTGGALTVSGTMVMNRTSFINNTSVQHGAAIWSNSTLRIDNSIFSNNKVTSTAAYYGGAIYVAGGNTLINNVTFSNNSIAYSKVSPTLSYGGALYRAGGVVTVHNSILWGNSRGGNVADQLNAGVVIDYSIVQNNYSTGTEIKIGNPLFVNASNGDLHLKAGSLGIDGGSNSWQAFDKDLDGKPRVINSTVDLGAYESNGGEGIIIGPQSIPAITRGQYQDLALTFSGTASLVNWTLEAGTLPTGLVLTADGKLRGTPTVTGTFTFVVSVSDGTLAGNRQYTVSVLNGIGRLYVAQDARGDNNGSNWANAFTDLQPALALATAKDEIWVARGTYSAGPLATSYFVLKEGVKMYGGFAGTESALTERDSTMLRTSNETILDGSQGVPSYHVVYNNNSAVATALTNATVLDGFSISGGGSTGSMPNNINSYGGGIYNVGGAAVYRHLWIKNNLGMYGAGLFHNGNASYNDIRFSNNRSTGAYPRGAAVYNAAGFKLKNGFFENNRIIESASYPGYGAAIFTTGGAELKDVHFENNTITNGQGGAIYGYGSFSLDNVSFIGSQATTGGAMYITSGIPTLKNVVFENNKSTGSAGALYVSGGITIDSAVFAGNSAALAGGAIYVGGAVSINRTSFINNTSVQHGGAVWSSATLKISNSIFSRNKVSSTAAYYGGAVYLYTGTSTLTNNSYSNNSINYNKTGTVSFGGAVYRNAGTATLNNSIFWGNSRGLGIADQLSATVKVNNSIVQDGFTTGVNIIDKNPLFVNAAADDLSLTGCSPAINTGDDALATANLFDFAGKTRKKSVSVDMGAIEYQDEVLVITPAAIQPGTRGASFSQQLQANGGGGTYTYEVISGKLPDGLAMSASGLITGNPFVTGKFTFTVKASDGTLCGNTLYNMDIVPGTGVVRMFVSEAATSGANNGSTWTNAYLDLQNALKVAIAGDEIWVAKGTYSPGDLITSTYKLIEGVKLYGGFAGTESTLAERDTLSIRTTNQTILDGSRGVASRHVIYNAVALTNATIVDGFTITGGKAGTTSGNASESYYGGGIYNNKGAAIFRNLWVKGNSATTYGGGMINLGPSILSNIIFENNTVSAGSYQYGGGLYNNGAATLNNIEFINNKAALGGGLFQITSALTMNTVTFRNNSSTGAGGGFASYSGKVTVNGAKFIDNTAARQGAGLYQYSSTLTLSNAIFINNKVTGTAAYYGGAYYQYTGTAMLTNISMYKNSISYVNATVNKYGGAIFKNAGTLNLQNSILWNNTRGNSIADEMGLNVKVFNTLVQGGYAAGTTIVDKDPLFNLSTAEDLSLSACSPAINMGDNALSAGISKDYAGNPRIKAETVDLGAFENQQDRIIVTPATLNEGSRGTKYEQQLTAGGGAGSYTYAVSYGKLPDGLLLTASGQIKGKPINAGTYTFNVTASDGNLCGNRLYTMNVIVGTGKVRIYVNQAATAGMNNSSDWENGFLDLQQGITSAMVGDTIWVAKGTYSPGTTVSSTYRLKEGVKIFGGFAATEKELSDRDTTEIRGSNETILTGGNKSYHVVTNITALTMATELDGFTISGGRTLASGSSYNTFGGGILNYGGSIVFKNLWVKNNAAYYYGGGIFSNKASSFTNVIVENNTATLYGGGMSTTGESTFSNVQFIGNKAQQGAGLHNRSSNISISNATFKDNTATTLGGGLYSIVGNVTLNRAFFIGNTSNQHGGAIYKYSGTMNVYNSVFSRNKISASPGSGYYGGAIYHYTGITNLVNTSFSNNSISYTNASATNKYGGAIYRYTGTVNVYNSILWGNRRGNAVADQLPAGIIAGNSTIEGGYVTGTQILNKDPQFTNAAADDLSLVPCSPSINMGDNSKVAGITTDIIAEARIKHSTVDIGAYEYQGIYLESAEQTLSDADQWEPYNQQIVLEQSGDYSFTVSKGLLPDGLSISASGKITGEASAPGLYEFTLAVNGADACGSLNVKLRVMAKEAYIIEVLTPYPVPVKKNTGTTFEDLNLVTLVEVVLSDKTHVKYPVTWQAGNYNGEVEGVYTLSGVLTVPSPAVNKNNLLAVAKVAVVDPVYPYIVSIEQLPPVYVLSGTPFNQVLPILPTQVKVTYDTGTTDMLNLIWRSGTYDTKVGIYRVYAEILMKEGFVNPVGFEANLDIYAQQNIISVEDLAEVTVPLHTPAADLPLPPKVRVTYHDQTTGILNVTWDTTPYVADKGAEYDVKGILQLPALVSNTNSVTATNKIIIRKNIVSVKALTGVTTPYDTEFNDVLLPTVVNVVFDDNTTDTVGVEWKPGNYNRLVPGTYTLAGTLLYDESIDNTNNLQAAIAVTVLAKPKNIVSVAILETVKVSFGQALAAIPELKLPVKVTYDDGTTGSLNVIWDTEGYEPDSAAVYTFSGDIVLVDGVINKDLLTAEIKVEVGKKAIVAVTNPPIIDVAYGTAEDEIELPETVSVKYNDNSTGLEGVIWTSATYNALIEGSYVFQGEIANSDDIANPDELFASVTVRVGPKPLTVVSAVSEAVDIPYGTTFVNALPLMPKQVTVSYDNGTTGMLNVVWEEGNYVGDEPGEYLLNGRLQLLPGVINPDSVKAVLKVTVGTHIISTYTQVTGIEVNYGTTAADLILPDLLNAQFVDGGNQDLGVTWDLSTYNGNLEGKYVIKGSFNLPDDILNPANVIPQIEVTVLAKPKLIVAIKTETLKVNFGTAVADLVFPTISTATLDDGTTLDIAVVGGSFKPVEDYIADETGEYVFEGLLTLPEGVQNPENINPELLVVVGKKSIESLAEIPNLNVVYGTSFEGLTLPESVMVTYNDGSTEQLGLTWIAGSYDGNTPGVYTLQGTLIIPDDIDNPKALQPVMKVNVAEKIRSLVSVEKVAVTVPYGTAADLIALPGTVTGTFDDGSTAPLTVVEWTTEEYDPLEPGKYNFYSTVVMPVNTVNPEEVKALAEVTVEDKFIVAVDPLTDLTVAFGTAYDELDLPAAVKVTYNNGSQEQVSVEWASANYDGNTVGEYTLPGIIIPEAEGQNKNNLTAAVKVVVLPKLLEIESIVVTNPIHVPFGTTLAALMTQLGTEVKVIYTDKTEGTAGISWETESFNGTVPGSYDFAGTITPAVGAANPNDLSVKLQVIVDRRNVIAIEEAAAITDVYGKAFSDLELPSTVKVTYDDQTSEYLSVSWNESGYRNNVFEQQQLSGTVELPDDITNTLNLPALVKLTLLKDVESVAALSPITVSFGTPLANLGLPATVEVTYNDGSKENVAVTWDAAAYAAAQVGMFDLTGTLILPANALNSDQLTALVNLTIEKVVQTISFDAIPAKVYGDAPFKLTAVASSGLPVSFQIVEGGIEITGDMARIISSGDVVIKAVQAGNATINKAEAQQTFTISKATLTVTGDNVSRLAMSPNPAFTYHIEGFVYEETEAVSREEGGLSGDPLLSTVATEASDAGTYPITPEVGELTATNYDFIFVPGVLTVNSRFHTVSWNTAEGTPIEASQVEDGELIAPAVSTREGYVLYGWFSDAAKETSYNFDAPVREDLTLYAEWQLAPLPLSGPISMRMIADYMLALGEMTAAERAAPFSMSLLNSKGHLPVKTGPFKLSSWYGYGQLKKAILKTITVAGNTTDGVRAGAELMNNGGSALTAAGICWSTTPNPTIANQKTALTLVSGSATSALPGLTSGVKYYLKAYATNTSGTAYGNEVIFTITEEGLIQIEKK